MQFCDPAQRGGTANASGARPSRPQHLHELATLEFLPTQTSDRNRCGLEGRAPGKSSRLATISGDTDRSATLRYSCAACRPDIASASTKFSRQRGPGCL